MVLKTDPESAPGKEEHIGKFIHTEVLDSLITKDPKTKKELDNLVKRLLATQISKMGDSQRTKIWRHKNLLQH